MSRVTDSTRAWRRCSEKFGRMPPQPSPRGRGVLHVSRRRAARLRIIALGGRSADAVNRRELEGWRVQTTHRYALYMFLGDHFFIRAAEAELIAIIRREVTSEPARRE